MTDAEWEAAYWRAHERDLLLQAYAECDAEDAARDTLLAAEEVPQHG